MFAHAGCFDVPPDVFMFASDDRATPLLVEAKPVRATQPLAPSLVEAKPVRVTQPLALILSLMIACSLSLLLLLTGARHLPNVIDLRSVSLAAERRVLITGYLPFGNMTSNPAAEVALALNGTCRSGTCVTAITLPVNRSGASRVASELEHLAGDRAPWQAVIHLGFEAISKGLRLEIAAANLLAGTDHVPGWRHFSRTPLTQRLDSLLS